MSRLNTSSAERGVRQSLEEYGRGVAGGLLFSLPLLYTMEVWWSGFLARPGHLLVYTLVTVLLLLGYNCFAGLRRDASWAEVVIDSVEEMGIGLVLATLVLYLLGQVSLEFPWLENLGKVVVESMPLAIGVSVGTAQLGLSTDDAGTDETDSGGKEEDLPRAPAQLVLALCGAMLFAANIGPTEEILRIATESTTYKIAGIAALSLVCGALILFYTAFSGSDRHVRRDDKFWVSYGIVTSYAAAIVASALILWFFGRFDGVTLGQAASYIVVLSFPAMLGASAGRLLIQ